MLRGREGGKEMLMLIGREAGEDMIKGKKWVRKC
jgi:hypothetical protein